MLLNEFNNLSNQLEDLTKSLNEIFDQLDQLLARNDKNYTIQFKKKVFHFYPATTKREYKEMKRNRHKLIKLLLLLAFESYVKLMPVTSDFDITTVFDSILCFTYGPDPKDMQFEKIDLEDLYEVTDSNGERVTALPLNLESPYVQADLKGDHVEPCKSMDS